MKTNQSLKPDNSSAHLPANVENDSKIYLHSIDEIDRSISIFINDKFLNQTSIENKFAHLNALESSSSNIFDSLKGKWKLSEREKLRMKLYGRKFQLLDQIFSPIPHENPSGNVTDTTLELRNRYKVRSSNALSLGAYRMKLIAQDYLVQFVFAIKSAYLTALKAQRLKQIERARAATRKSMGLPVAFLEGEDQIIAPSTRRLMNDLAKIEARLQTMDNEALVAEVGRQTLSLKSQQLSSLRRFDQLDRQLVKDETLENRGSHLLKSNRAILAKQLKQIENLLHKKEMKILNLQDRFSELLTQLDASKASN